MAGEFVALEVTTPDADDLERLLGAIGLELRVSYGEPELQVRIQSQRGEVVLRSTTETSAVTLV